MMPPTQPAFTATFLLLFTAHLADAANSLRVVTYTGQPVQSEFGDLRFRNSNMPPVINNTGRVAFSGTLFSDGPMRQAHGIFEQGASQQIRASYVSRYTLVGEGQDFETLNYVTIDPVILNERGTKAFVGWQSTDGVWLSDKGRETTVKIAKHGELSPSGITYNRFNHPTRDAFMLVNDSDQFAFFDLNGIWFDDGVSGPQLAVSADEPLGDDSDFYFPNLNFAPSRSESLFMGLSDSGDVGFTGNASFGTNEPGFRGFWLKPADGPLELVAGGGMTPPGEGGQAEWLVSHQNSFSLGDDGEMVFTADFRRGNGEPELNGIWKRTTVGQIQPVVIAGDSLDIIGSTRQFSGVGERGAVLGGRGEIVFDGRFTETLDSGASVSTYGAFKKVDEETEVLALSGHTAPGTDGLAEFDRIGFAAGRLNYGNGWITTNNAGQAVFGATLTGEGIDNTNNLGIWAEDRSGELKLIVRTGDFVQVAPGDNRQIEAFYFWGSYNNHSGLPSGFNDRGELTFLASFADGSQGILVSNAVAVPEPAAIVLLSITLLAASTLRRRGNIHTLCECLEYREQESRTA